MKTPILAIIFAIAGTMAAQAQTAPPCDFQFTSEDEFAKWTVIDGNPSDSPVVWEWSGFSESASYDTDNEAADDWLISPAISLEAGETYNITFVASSTGLFSTHKFDITVGQESSIAGQSAILSTEDDFSSTDDTEIPATFTPQESGTYYFGFHCTSSYYNGELRVSSMSIIGQSDLPEYPTHVTNLTAEAGANGKMEVTLTWTWPSTNSEGGALSQLSGARIERMDNSSIWNSYEAIATVEGATIGGQGSYVDSNIPASGPYSYRVTAFSADGDAQGGYAPTASVEWVGEDTPMPVGNLTAVASGDNAIINFTAPTAGVNGGYINLDAITYKIERKSGYSTTVVEEAYSGTLPYTDTGIAEIGSYTYAVTAISATGGESETVESAAVVAGPAFTTPYEADLSNADEASLFSFINANQDIYEWRYSSYSGVISYFGGSEADDYAATPRIRMEAGKAYRVTVTARLNTFRSVTEDDYKTISANVGNALTAEAMTQSGESVVVTTDNEQDYAFTTSVAADGDYYIGIRVFGHSNTNDIYLTYIKVEEIPTAPASIADLTAARADNGALAATVAWTNPTVDNAGNPLAEITKYEIYRNETELVHSQSDVVPGSQATFTDNTITEAGVYSYTVRLYLGENHSDTSVETEWVGFDTPAAIAEVVATASDSQVTLAFDAPAEGVHGGLLETDGMGYAITRNGETIETLYTGALPYIDNVPELGVYVYTVAAVTPSGLSSEPTESNSVTAGDAMNTPYEADFSVDGTDFDLMSTFDGNEDGSTWSYSRYDEAVQISSSKNDKGDWLFTPRLNLSNEYRYKLTVAASLSRAWDEDDYTIVNVYAGESDSPEGQTPIGSFTIDSAYETNYEFDIELGESGKMRIGLQEMGNNGFLTYVNIHSISVIEAGTSSVAAIEAGSLLRYDRATQTIACPDADGRLSVVNAAGVEMLNCHATDTPVNVGSLPAGLYIAVFTNRDGNIDKLKFIK